MSEYIITSEQIEELNKANNGMQIVTSWLSAYAIFDTSEFPPLMKSQHLAITLPNIVRCRDCIWYDPDYYLGKWCTNLGFSLQEQTDGFCAWGKRISE